MARVGLCATPEEIAPPAVLSAAMAPQAEVRGRLAA
jgi:hypothetical protein